ncbi:isoprenylcysteine carboxylmethyltransferase family protein [Babesia caballi]|uniref:Isoprenylcysteine carboxylmethyltransferase family protein n=1 Tax=Babesia caballi TaxID=5871 RepID=A0AAV4LQP6_BABCB|nr:isoprenylcysteine carboxylmethyltransferase family protein [Babesia caballi]
MVDVRPELLDLHSEFKCGVFGVCCLLTLLAFCYVLYRLAVAPCRMPWSELSVVLLSCTQLLFGIFFYFGSQHPFLQIVNKAIKVVQAEIVSWSCLKLVLTNKKQRRRMVGGMLNLVSCGIVATLGYGLFTVYDDTIYLNAKIGIIMSSMWCLMSMTVIYVAYKIRKSIQTTQLTPADELEERDGTVGGSERGGSDLVGCYSKTKYQHLLLLVVVEAVTAMVSADALCVLC